MSIKHDDMDLLLLPRERLLDIVEEFEAKMEKGDLITEYQVGYQQGVLDALEKVTKAIINDEVVMKGFRLIKVTDN